MPRKLIDGNDLAISRRAKLLHTIKETRQVLQLEDCEGIECPPPAARKLKTRHFKCDKTSAILITQEQFCNSKNGIIITKPGLYRFKEDIEFSPSVTRTAAISITASNVILDLDRFTLRQTNATPLIYGIFVCRDVNNFKLTGSAGVAQIVDFSLAGIRVFGRTDTITIENIIVTQTEIKQLTNDEIPVDCANILCLRLNVGIVIGEGDPGYISMAGTDRNNKVTHLTIRNIIAKRSSVGCHIVFTSGITVDDSTFTENTYYGLIIGTIWIVLDDAGEPIRNTANNGVITNCRFDQNKSTQNALLTNPGDTFMFDFVAAISFNQVENFVVRKSTVHDNSSDSFILAADHDGSRNMTWKNCTIKRNRSDFFICDGFHMSGSIANTLGPCLGSEFGFDQNHNFVIEDCDSEDNFGEASCSNFRFAFPSGGRVTNCSAAGATSGLGGLAAGFRCQGDLPGGQGQDLVFSNCISQRNMAIEPSIEAGFIINEVMRNVVIRDCIIQDNGNPESAAVLSGGIVIQPRLSAGIENVTIEGNTINNNGSLLASSSAGILAFTDDPTLSINRVLVQNNTLAYNRGDGVRFEGGVTGVVVKKNEADQNEGVGFNLDGATPPIFVTKNIAYNNTGGNYAGVPATNIVVGDINDLPANVGFKNLSVTA